MRFWNFIFTNKYRDIQYSRNWEPIKYVTWGFEYLGLELVSLFLQFSIEFLPVFFFLIIFGALHLQLIYNFLLRKNFLHFYFKNFLKIYCFSDLVFRGIMKVLTVNLFYVSNYIHYKFYHLSFYLYQSGAGLKSRRFGSCSIIDVGRRIVTHIVGPSGIIFQNMFGCNKKNKWHYNQDHELWS